MSLFSTPRISGGGSGGGGGGVTQLIAGSNITLSPSGGTGVVTVNAGGGTSPITIQNTSSLFSTGLPGLWTSNATDSIIFGQNASDNSSGSSLDSVIWLGDLSGASDGSQAFQADRSTFIGNRSGYNAFNAQNSTFIGYLAGAYSTNAAYSVFMGAQAGEEAPYAGNSFFFGQGAGHQATVGADSIFMGLLSGASATNAASSVFFGSFTGYNATNANNAIFIGSNSGNGDTVNNQGLITYTDESHVFDIGQPITSTSGGSAVVLSDDGAGNMVIMDSVGAFNVGDTVTQTNGGYTARLVTYSPSTSSVLIGGHTSTGGGKNSVAIGAHANNAGYNNSIVIGVNGLNTMDNQYAWGDEIINWRFSGNNFALPTVAPSGNGQFLGVTSGNQLFWGVPGAEGGLTVLAATTTFLPYSPVYSNGTGGVGATLTASTNGALVVDGITIPLNGRVLVKDEVTQINNGVYQLSTIGDSSTHYVLTRTTDADTSVQFTDMVVSPSEGTQSSTAFGQQTPMPTIGTDNIIFASLASLYLRQQTSGTQSAYQIPVYTGTGLTLTKGDANFQYNPSTGTFLVGVAPYQFKMLAGDTTVGSDGFEVINSVGNQILTAQYVSGFNVAGMGDLVGTGHSTSLIVDDNLQKITLLGTHIQIPLAAYDSDASAGTAGLVAGEQYQTNGLGTGVFAFLGVTMTKQ